MNKYFTMLLASLLSVSAVAADTTRSVTLTSDNTVVLADEIDTTTVGRVMQEASTLDAKLKSNEPIYLVLSSPGGSIQDGLEMITYLNNLNRPVHTITIFSASMAFQTVQQLGDRLVTPFGTLMAHKARGRFQGEFPGQVDSRYIYYIKRLNEMDRLTVKRTSGKYTVASLQALYENEYWVDGFDAVGQGLADAVVSAHCDHSLAGTVNNNIDFMGFSITLIQSKCPMNQGIISFVINIHTDQGIMKLADFLAKGGSLSGRSSSSYSYNPYGNDHYGPTPLVQTVTVIPPVPTTEGLTLEKINVEVTKIKDQFKSRKAVVRE